MFNVLADPHGSIMFIHYEKTSTLNEIKEIIKLHYLKINFEKNKNVYVTSIEDI